jgi:uncharacterized membrane protein
MQNIPFPEEYLHDHPPIRDVITAFEGQKTLGHRAADRVVRVMGSWRFVIIQSVILVFWVILNITAWVQRWDPYPFILMNLFLSLQAAYTAPMILMSQNRDAERDRMVAANDYEINQTAEKELRIVLAHLEAEQQALFTLYMELQQIRVHLGMATTTDTPPAPAPTQEA